MFGIFGVYLYPFASQKLLGFPGNELTNQRPGFTSALGKPGAELEEQIFLASGNLERYKLLTTFLEDQFDRNTADEHPFNAAARHIIHSPKTYSVWELAQFSGYHPTTFFSGEAEGTE